MARNLKREYIKKLMAMENNGYKFDAANYIYNPSYDYDYPSFIKVIAEDEATETIRRVYYFKHYNGNGEYIAETYKRSKDNAGWQIIPNPKQEKIAEANRFSLKALLGYCV